MIHKPGAPDLYGYLEAKDQMPAFGADQLTENDVTTVIRYLKNDYTPPNGRPGPPASQARRSVTPGPSPRRGHNNCSNRLRLLEKRAVKIPPEATGRNA